MAFAVTGRNAEDDLFRALFVLHAVQVDCIRFRLNALGKKKAPTPVQVEVEVCAFGRMGDDHRPFDVRRTRI
jgi:hypothetical protein